ncbi:hypothetical protein J6590_095670 [Homalodisca vitripennis]|nr:hypothetical protein J6590_095670 [Homalodisca vitripennis]
MNLDNTTPGFASVKSRKKISEASKIRIVHDLLFLKKLICSVIDAPDLLELLDFRVSRHLRHPQMFARRHYTTQYMFHSVFPHLPNKRLANNLPRHQDFFNMSCVTFKRELRLACHDLHIV